MHATNAVSETVTVPVRMSVSGIHRGARLGALPPRGSLARQAALVYFEVDRRHESNVCRDTVSSSEGNYIAGYEFVRKHMQRLAIAV